MLKSNSQEAPSACHQGKKLQQHQANKNCHLEKKPHFSSNYCSGHLVLKFLPRCYLTSKENIIFRI